LEPDSLLTFPFCCCCWPLSSPDTGGGVVVDDVGAGVGAVGVVVVDVVDAVVDAVDEGRLMGTWLGRSSFNNADHSRRVIGAAQTIGCAKLTSTLHSNKYFLEIYFDFATVGDVEAGTLKVRSLVYFEFG